MVERGAGGVEFESNEPPASDGRRRRCQQSRQRILHALAKALSEPDIDITAARPADTPDILAAVLSVATWSHIRTTQGHSAERAAALLESAVLRLLGEQPRKR